MHLWLFKTSFLSNRRLAHLDADQYAVRTADLVYGIAVSGLRMIAARNSRGITNNLNCG